MRHTSENISWEREKAVQPGAGAPNAIGGHRREAHVHEDCVFSSRCATVSAMHWLQRCFHRWQDRGGFPDQHVARINADPYPEPDAAIASLGGAFRSHTRSPPLIPLAVRSRILILSLHLRALAGARAIEDERLAVLSLITVSYCCRRLPRQVAGFSP